MSQLSGDLAPFCTHLPGEALDRVPYTPCNPMMMSTLWLGIRGPSQAQVKPTFLSFVQDFLGVCCVPVRYWTQNVNHTQSLSTQSPPPSRGGRQCQSSRWQARTER